MSARIHCLWCREEPLVGGVDKFNTMKIR
jgi:hypothetical protein